jgi:hypothetical protein
MGMEMIMSMSMATDTAVGDNERHTGELALTKVIVV